MSKNIALVAFGISVLLLLVLVWFHSGSFAPPSGEDSIWFHSGLLTLLIGRYIIEYKFTRPNDVFVNCIIVFASTSTLSDPPNQVWWDLVRWGSLVVGVTAIVLSWDHGQDERTQSGFLRILIYKFVLALGRSQVIFSIVFVLALVSYFQVGASETVLFAVTWGLILITSNLDLGAIANAFRDLQQGRDELVRGRVCSFVEPSIVICQKTDGGIMTPKQVVGFRHGGARACHCYGLVVGERKSAFENHVAVALWGGTIQQASLSGKTELITFKAEELSDLINLGEAELAQMQRVVGVVAKKTNTSRLRFELFGNPSIRAGSLLSVRSGDSDVFYQVFDGSIEEERSVEESDRAFVEGEAEQVGCWEENRGGFETHDWVPRELATVHLIGEQDTPPPYQLKETEMSLGTVPRSLYSVNIDLNDFVLFHTAILGVTGSGKSFLTYGAVESAAAKGIKVVCIDPTGDYQKYLHQAVTLNRDGALRAFLNSQDHQIGIIETGLVAMHPIAQTLAAAQICLEWARANRSQEEILNSKAKVLVVLEEAHLLVPEFNFNPDRDMQNRVSQIAQVVLQARKYGLGFLVVSQRTANVVKSVLNQCNTMVSFQAFDETGFDFLRNYMGAFHVSSLPNLKSRHAILVGKASKSKRPIMVRLVDQARVLREQPAEAMPVPVGPPSQGAGPHVHNMA